jgi:porin
MPFAFADGIPMNARTIRILFLLCVGLWFHVVPVHSQEQEETLSGPDSHETGQGPHGHLLGDWGGERTRLQERGVNFDFQYVSHSLWNLKSVQPERFASWNRFRGTVDIDFGELIGQQGWHFHATALWQGGGNLGTYLGLLTSPSGMSSENTCRLDSWWIEKRWLDERIALRAGQFARLIVAVWVLAQNRAYQWVARLSSRKTSRAFALANRPANHKFLCD